MNQVHNLQIISKGLEKGGKATEEQLVEAFTFFSDFGEPEGQLDAEEFGKILDMIDPDDEKPKVRGVLNRAFKKAEEEDKDDVKGIEVREFTLRFMEAVEQASDDASE